jgi:hypothetical protein
MNNFETQIYDDIDQTQIYDMNDYDTDKSDNNNNNNNSKDFKLQLQINNNIDDDDDDDVTDDDEKIITSTALSTSLPINNFNIPINDNNNGDGDDRMSQDSNESTDLLADNDDISNLTPCNFAIQIQKSPVISNKSLNRGNKSTLDHQLPTCGDEYDTDCDEDQDMKLLPSLPVPNSTTPMKSFIQPIHDDNDDTNSTLSDESTDLLQENMDNTQIDENGDDNNHDTSETRLSMELKQKSQQVDKELTLIIKKKDLAEEEVLKLYKESEQAKRDKEREEIELAVVKEQERLDEERLDKEILEKERIDKEIIDKERIDKEIHDKERIDKERIDKERIDKAILDKERIDKEILHKEILDKERIDKEILESIRLEEKKKKPNKISKSHDNSVSVVGSATKVESVSTRSTRGRLTSKDNIDKDNIDKDNKDTCIIETPTIIKRSVRCGKKSVEIEVKEKKEEIDEITVTGIKRSSRDNQLIDDKDMDDTLVIAKKSKVEKEMKVEIESDNNDKDNIITIKKYIIEDPYTETPIQRRVIKEDKKSKRGKTDNVEVEKNEIVDNSSSNSSSYSNNNNNNNKEINKSSKKSKLSDIQSVAMVKKSIINDNNNDNESVVIIFSGIEPEDDMVKEIGATITEDTSRATHL